MANRVQHRKSQSFQFTFATHKLQTGALPLMQRKKNNCSKTEARILEILVVISNFILVGNSTKSKALPAFVEAVLVLFSLNTFRISEVLNVFT